MSRGVNNPFEDPVPDKSPPTFSNYDSSHDLDYLRSAVSKPPGTPPLPTYLSFGSRNANTAGSTAVEPNNELLSLVSDGSAVASARPGSGIGSSLSRQMNEELVDDNDSPTSNITDKYAAYTSSPPEAAESPDTNDQRVPQDHAGYEAMDEQFYPSSPLAPPPKSPLRGHYVNTSGTTKVGTEDGEYQGNSFTDHFNGPVADPFASQNKPAMLYPASSSMANDSNEQVDIKTVLNEEPPPIPQKSFNRQPLFGKRLNLPVNLRSNNGESRETAVQLPNGVGPARMPVEAPAYATPNHAIRDGATERLKTQRHRMVSPNHRRERALLSPAALRLAFELRQNNGIPLKTGARAVLRSVPFWGMIIVFQLSMVSTAAAIAVIIVRTENTSTSGETVGSGCMFWLVISILLFVASVAAVLFVWARCMGYFSSFQQKIGLDEIALLDQVMQPEANENGPDIKVNPGSTSQLGVGQLEPSGSVRSMVSSHYQSMYAEPRSNYDHTPLRRHTSPSGFSPAVLNEASPISPMKPAHLRQFSRYPSNANHNSEVRFPSNVPHVRYGKQPERIRIQDHRGGSSDVVASQSPLEDLGYGLKVAHSAPESERLNLVETYRAISKDRSNAMRQSIERPSRLRRTSTYDSSPDVSHQITITEVNSERSPLSRKMSEAERYSLQLHLEHIGKQVYPVTSQLPRSRNVPNLADQATSIYNASEPGLPEHKVEFVDLNKKKASISYGSMPQTPNGEMSNSKGKEKSKSKDKERESSITSKTRGFFNDVKGHFTEQHGRSLGSVIRDHHSKSKDGSPV